MASRRTETYSFSKKFQDSIKWIINYYFCYRDRFQLIRPFKHVPEDIAYDRMVHDLSTIENRFYDHFDKQNLKNTPGKRALQDFSIQSISIMLNLLYNVKYCYIDNDDEPKEDEDSQDKEYAPVTSKTAKETMSCAHYIWRAWMTERVMGPRLGTMLISNIQAGAEKVLLVSWINGKYYNLGYPKGKPNINERIRDGCFREFIEETGIGISYERLYAAFANGNIIRKEPYMGYRSRRQFCVHYYVITTIPDECTSFQVDRREVWNAEWYSIYRLPCCKDCKVARRFISINGSELEINYHMVTLLDVDGEDSAVLYLLAYVDAVNGNRSGYVKYKYTHRQCRSEAV